MIGISMNQLAEVCNGKLISGNATLQFSDISLDSRKISESPDTLFIAIAGERHDGHQYISSLFEKGLRMFLIEKELDVQSFPGACFCLVDSAVKALQKFASFHRSCFQIPVIGLTGSNGKTVVKEWLNMMLAGDYVIVRSPRSYNSQIGVPLSVIHIQDNHDLGIFEAGISKPGEMDSLAEIIKPEIGIFTHLGNAHLENFTSKEELVSEKLKLFLHSEVIIHCADEPEIEKALLNTHFQKIRKIGWGYTQKEKLDQGFFIEKKESGADFTILSCYWKGLSMSFSIGFTDAASIENAISCIVCLLHLGYNAEVISERLNRLSSLQMRLEVLDGIKHSLLINDAYSSDLHSLEIALDFLKSNSGNKETVAILSDLAQSGMNEDALYRKVNQLLKSRGIQFIIGIGPSIHKALHSFEIPGKYFSTTEEFILAHPTELVADKAVLVKGARIFRFERIISILQDKSHETRLEIDLAAMVHNLNYFRSRIRPDTKLMVMVKAFGYGSGAREVASLLQFNRVDYLAVAYADEGVELRRAGISLPILVMNPEPGTFDVIIRSHLEPEIFSLNELDLFLEELKYHSTKNPFPIHLKLDSGMHRLGFMPEEIETLCAKLNSSKAIRISSVFSHLSSSENPEHDFFTKKQIASFEKTCEYISAKTGQTFVRHILNTGGIQRFPDAQYEMVRLGIGLYGVSSNPDEQKNLRRVSSFLSKISQIKKIAKGDIVGYSMSFIASEPMTIAIIPVGYADGLKRSLSNGKGHVMIKGQKASILGKICMDMTMVNVSHINCQEGDDVEIFGPNLSLDEFAKLCDTIPYEVLTSVNQRVKRIYLQE